MNSTTAIALSLLSLVTGIVAHSAPSSRVAEKPFVVVLGIAQDGGAPQAGCLKDCCAAPRKWPSLRCRVTCLAIVDPESGERWMIEATPDFPEQLQMLDDYAPPREGVPAPAAPPAPALDGILLTHGHIGHYTGLIHLGREVIGAKETPVYVMPRMQAFLESNGPWDQLVKLKNIAIRPLTADTAVQLNSRIKVTPFLVPHRDEYTETVGFRIDGPSRSIVFIPDIDKWEKWDKRVEDVIAGCDIAYLDGTFYTDGELPGRSMAEIPHPFIVESMQRFAPLPESERRKIRFIHLNHTNPALRDGGDDQRRIQQAEFDVAREGERQPL